MSGWTILKNFMVCIFEIYVLLDFSACIFSKKGSAIYRTAVSLGGIILLTAVNSFNNPSLNLICVPLIYLGIIFLIFEERLVRKLCLSVIYYFLIIIPEFLFALWICLNGLQDYRQQMSGDINELVMLVLMKNMTFILAKLMGHFYQKREVSAGKDWIFAMMMIQPVATLTILASLFYADIQLGRYGKPLLFTGIFLLLFSNIFVFYVFDRLIFHMEKAQKMEMLYTKSQIEKRHFEYLEKITDRHSELLHDIKRYIRTACELIHSGEAEDAIRLFSDLGIKMNRAHDFHFSNHKVLNAILNERKETADRKNLRYQVEVETGIDTGFVRDIDAIAILGNLIDNAIEAAEKTENGYVEIRMYTENGGRFLIWEVKNNFAELRKKNKVGFITSKKNKREHGIGLHTVEKLVAQYGGILQTKVNGQEFTAFLLFSILK